MATSSLMVCENLLFSKSSGMTETVAMYMKPPAVKGRIQAVAASPIPSASRETAQPVSAPTAVNSCKKMA